MIVSENSSARDEDVEKLVRVAGVAEPPDQTLKPRLTEICCAIQKEIAQMLWNHFPNLYYKVDVQVPQL